MPKWTRYAKGRIVLSILVLAALGCGGGGRGSASGYSQTLRAVEPAKLMTDTRDYLRRLGYDLEVENGPPAILLQTQWRSRLPTDQEREAGVTEARTRFRVTGRQRQITDATEVYVPTLRIEHHVRLGNGAPWQELPATSDFLEWARTTARELELDLQSGRGG